MRLIDADKLKEEFDQDDWGNYLDSDVRRIIDNAPTIARSERPFVMIEGKAIYITQGHIDAMVEYERKEQVKEVVERFMKSLEEVADDDTTN
jgi:hypothetical protein